MNFCEKIRMILKNNELKITSASKLEEYVGVGRRSITAHYKKEGKPCVETEPGLMVQAEIQEKLRINKDWWEHGRGEMYIKTEQQNEVASENEAESSPPTLLQILLESVRGVNKLVDANNGLVDKLTKDKDWALAELEKLHAKFGAP